MKSSMKGERVNIRWVNADHDWYWFVVQDTKKHGWVRLKGRDAPDGALHDGTEFWAHVSEMKSITPGD